MFNAQETIIRALQSIASQNFQNFECIVIDNNSTDKSPELVSDFISNHPCFSLIKEPRQGVMYASNAGCKLAKGEFVARMDADDEALPSRLQLQVDFLDTHQQTDAVGGLVEYIAHNANTEGFARYVNWVNTLVIHNEIFPYRFIESPIVNPTAMWRKSSADKFGLYKKGDFPEDYEMWLRWLQQGAKIEKVNQPILKWYDSDTRLTRTHEIYSDEAFFRIKTLYLANHLKQQHGEMLKVWIWGASKISRKHQHFLTEQNITIEGYIDTKQGRILDKEVLLYKNITKEKQRIVLVYMRHLDLRHQIEEYLKGKGYSNGEDFFLVS
jgi:glycosyltransferase involved in cell wall biosynthesis